MSDKECKPLFSGEGKEATVSISREYIKETYEKGHFVEAIILIHVVIDAFMRMTLDKKSSLINWENHQAEIERMRRRSSKGKQTRVNTVYNRYSYWFLVNVLFDLGVYDWPLLRKLKKFNQYRNDIAHRLLIDIPSKKSKIDTKFKSGMEAWTKVAKIHQKVNQEWWKLIESDSLLAGEVDGDS